LVGEANVAGEVSFRSNMPLVGSGNTVIVPSSLGAYGDSKAAFPVGRTLHAYLSAIDVLAATPFWVGASVFGELAFN
ncbi:DUF1302 family protein, partial [Pseudomonas sp. 5B4]|nr:DUF1302 family protein [Pseudomonas sp. 5B4]